MKVEKKQRFSVFQIPTSRGKSVIIGLLIGLLKKHYQQIIVVTSNQFLFCHTYGNYAWTSKSSQIPNTDNYILFIDFKNFFKLNRESFKATSIIVIFDVIIGFTGTARK